jgi:TfoX/Sxy family transcriptional regulator of competence genes
MAKRPTMPTCDPKIAALFETLLPIDERVVIRPMFGHKAAFVNGNMFTGTFGKHVFVRLDEPSRPELPRGTVDGRRRQAVRADERASHDGVRTVAGVGPQRTMGS